MGSPFVGIVHPSKIYGTLEVGRPFVFIGPRKSHIGDLVHTERIGNQIEHGQSAALAGLILAAAQAQEATHAVEQIIAVSERFSKERLSEQFIQTLVTT